MAVDRREHGDPDTVEPRVDQVLQRASVAAIGVDVELTAIGPRAHRRDYASDEPRAQDRLTLAALPERDDRPRSSLHVRKRQRHDLVDGRRELDAVVRRGEVIVELFGDAADALRVAGYRDGDRHLVALVEDFCAV